MTRSFFFPTTGIEASQAMLLAIDDYSLPLRRNLCYYITRPTVRLEPVLAPSHDRRAPDACATHFYGSVIRDGDRYRMWYYALHYGEGQGTHPGDLVEGPTCYAESDDGLHWIKPALRQVEWRGSLENNIVKLAHLRSEGVHVIRDDEDPNPARRYKMVYNYRPADRPWWTIRTATSPDGLHWTDGGDLPFDGFIEQAALYKHNGLYYVNGQMHSRSEGGHRAGRQAFVIVSPDFDHWLPEQGESFLLPEPADPAGRGYDKPYDQAHIGVGAASFGNVLVGLYCIWHNAPYPTAGDWFGTGTTSGDLGLLVSNDGQHFREPVKGHVWLHRTASPPSRVPAGKYETVLCQSNAILNVGEETRIYHGRWVNAADIADYYAEVALATLPRDRWGALGLYGDQAEGSVWSCPVKLPEAGCQVVLNADRACDMRIEVADERFALIPDYAAEQSGTAAAEGGLDCPVSWPAGSLERLGGQTVRFRVHLKRGGASEPRLYALYLR